MLLGDSVQIKEINEIIKQVAPTDVTVLITGESGTGKEVVAKEIHKASKRKDKPYIIVNCGAIPEGIIESELFGHKKGSFTGAIEDRKGYFETADKGTIFLDEIGDMSLSAQAKVLRALQENKIARVGGDKEIKINVRVIPATNKNLQKEIEVGNFREDLFHRLSVIPIHVPSLEERIEDIPILTLHFIELITQEMGIAKKEIEPNAVKELQQKPWPGNIRQFRNVIERLIILSAQSITLNDVKQFA